MGLLQLIFDGAYAWGPWSMLLDYLLAYGVLGVAGFFWKQKNGLFTGTVVACICRFIIHFISGITIYKIYEPTEVLNHIYTNPYLYSAVYNGSFFSPSTWCSASSSSPFSTSRSSATSPRRIWTAQQRNRFTPGSTDIIMSREPSLPALYFISTRRKGVFFMGIFDGVLLASDYDGTLRGSTLEVLERDRAAIDFFQREGGRFILTTGRCYAAFYQQARELSAPLAHTALQRGHLLRDGNRAYAVQPRPAEPGAGGYGGDRGPIPGRGHGDSLRRGGLLLPPQRLHGLAHEPGSRPSYTEAALEEMPTPWLKVLFEGEHRRAGAGTRRRSP